MYIEKYNKWIKDNPNKVCKKIKAIYEKLEKDMKIQKEVSFFNAATGEVEKHTYRFD